MDYKYIEQLLERYWAAETSPEEETILRAFFSQHDIPAALQPYAELFCSMSDEAQVALGEEFDSRVLQDAGLSTAEKSNSKAPVVKPRRVLKPVGLRPLYQAAATVAIVVLISLGAQRLFSPTQQNDAAWDYNADSYSDTYSTPTQAYHVLESGLEMFQKTASADTAKVEKSNVEQKADVR